MDFVYIYLKLISIDSINHILIGNNDQHQGISIAMNSSHQINIYYGFLFWTFYCSKGYELCDAVQNLWQYILHNKYLKLDKIEIIKPRKEIKLIIFIYCACDIEFVWTEKVVCMRNIEKIFLETTCKYVFPMILCVIYFHVIHTGTSEENI